MSTTVAGQGSPAKPFLTDVQTLRDRARKNLSEGVVTKTYGGDVKQTIEILQSVLATEIVCVLRYTMHAVTATGISSEGIKAEFAQHAKEEQAHMMAVAERIDQLGGTPNFNPEGLAMRSASQYAEVDNLVEMIRENLIAERIAVDHYRELIRFFGDDDPATRVMLEGVLVTEEEHANDLSDVSTWEEVRTKATDGSLEVDVHTDNTYVLSGLADDLTDGPDSVDPVQLDLAVELLTDAAEWSDDDSVDTALGQSESLGWLVSFILRPDPTRLAPSPPFDAEVEIWRKKEKVKKSSC